MTDTRTANDLLMSNGGPPAFKFDKIGDTAKGRITGLSTQQATDFVTKEPKTYSNGDPIMQAVITLAQDDGEECRVFVKPKQREAIRDAVAAAGADGVQEGGTLAVQYVADGTPDKPGLNPPKLFKAQYKAPVAAIATDDLL